MQKFSFKKGMAFALAATTALSGLPASPTVAYAATEEKTAMTDTDESKVITTTTLEKSDIRVIDSNFVYNGAAQMPVLYFDVDGDKKYDDGKSDPDDKDIILTDFSSIKSAMRAEFKNSNVNASEAATIVLPKNTYKVDATHYYKTNDDYVIKYPIGQADFSKAIVYYNGDLWSNTVKKAGYSSGGVSFELSGKKFVSGEDEEKNNIVNVYLPKTSGKSGSDLSNYNLLKDPESEITIKTDDNNNAMPGSTYTLTLSVDTQTGNYKTSTSTPTSITRQYTAVRDLTDGTEIELRTGRDNLIYNGRNQALTLDDVDAVKVNGSSVNRLDFVAFVAPSSFGATQYQKIVEYNEAQTQDEKNKIALQAGFNNPTDYEESIHYSSSKPYVRSSKDGKTFLINEAKHAGSYNLFLVPDDTKYNGFIVKSFSVKSLDVSTLRGSSRVNLNISAEYTYRGTAIEPINMATVYDGNFPLGEIKKGEGLTVSYSHNINAPQAEDEYVSALDEVGLIKKDNNGHVTIYNVAGQTSGAAALIVTGAKSTDIRDYNDSDMPSYVKTKYSNPELWRSAAVSAATSAMEKYLPSATLKFTSNDISGEITVNKVFAINQFDLSTANILGADDTANKSNTYSVKEGNDPILLRENGIQFQQEDGIGKLLAPSSALKAEYAYYASGDAPSTLHKFSELKDLSSLEYIYGKIDVVDGNNNVIGSKGVYFADGTTLNDSSKYTLNISETSPEYDGRSISRYVTVTGKDEERELIEGTDYILSYYLNGSSDPKTDVTDAGTYVVQARGVGKYAGTITNSITIRKRSLASKRTSNNSNSITVTTNSGVTTVGGVKLTDGKAYVPYKGNLSDAVFTNAIISDYIDISNTKSLTESDYEIGYRNDMNGANSSRLKGSDVVNNKGTYSVYLFGKGNYEGELDSGYDIVVTAREIQPTEATITSVNNLAESQIKFSTTSTTEPAKVYFTGSKITEDDLNIRVAVTIGKETFPLSEKDYTKKITVDASEVGQTGIVTITCPAESNYTAPSVSAYFMVVPGNLADTQRYDVQIVKDSVDGFEHNAKPSFKVIDNNTKKEVPYEYSGVKLNFNATFSFEDDAGKNAGKLSINVPEGANKEVSAGYSGNYVLRSKTDTATTRDVYFDTIPSVKKLRISGIADGTEYTYTGENLLPSIEVSNENGDKLNKGTDYTVTIYNAEQTASADAMIDALYTTNINAVGANANRMIREGEYSQPYHIVVRGIGDYTGTQVYSLYVLPRSIRDSSVKILKENRVYNGAEQEPVSLTFGDYKLEAGKDYDITYQNNKNVGTASFIVKGKNNFNGVYSVYENDPATFEITPAESTRVYTEDELKDEVQKAVDEALKNQTASGNAEEIQKIVDEKVAEAVASATEGMITKEDADKAVNDAVAQATETANAATDQKVADAVQAQKDADAATVNDATEKAATAQKAAEDAQKAQAAAETAQKNAEAAQKTAEAAQKSAEAAKTAAEKKATTATTVKKGDTFIVGKNIYQITNVSKKTAKFVGTYSKAKTITIPATAKNSKNSVSYKITTVAASAMKGNTTVTKVTIGKNVTKINGSAFQNCTKLATVTIGKNVKTIGKNAFNGDTKLKKVTIKSTKLKTVKSKAFKIAKKAKVTVPSGKASSYKKLLKSAGLPSTATVK